MLSFEYIQIEPTFNCNLLCGHCGRTRKYIGEEMSLKSFRMVLDQFKEHKVDFIAFNGGGEVFTLKKIVAMLSIMAERGYRVSTVSNGILLHQKDLEDIVNNELIYHLILSVEGATKKTFDSIRGKNTFKTFVKNIRKIQELKKSRNTPFPILTLNVVCMKDNLHELPLIVDFARENGIKEIIFVHLNPLIKASNLLIKNKLCVPDQHLSNCNPEEVKKTFRIVKEKTNKGHFDLVKTPNIEFNGLEMKKKDVVKKPYCPWLEKRTFINWEGYVIPCCQVGRHVINFGNIFEKNFQDIWNGSKFLKFREDFLSGNPHTSCKNCNEYNGVGFG